ncbi:high-copy hsp90 suppressor [Elasticomyces elasticus]|nr:high-copy hsp90 suppressor [Elasticomyces elasticus]KAK3659179.1 high-copy hsp90 suppressor [Elasticomyces elasticus]
MSLFKITIMTIAFSASFTIAAPLKESNPGDGSTKCGNGQKIACCNSGEDLIGLNCLSVPIRCMLTVATVTMPIQQACRSNVASCCQTADAISQN